MRLTVPFEPEPLDIALDGVDILLPFLGRVGVIEAQVALSVIILRYPEIETDRLGMAT